VSANLVPQEFAKRQAWLRAEMSFPRAAAGAGKTQGRAAQESGDIDVFAGTGALSQ